MARKNLSLTEKLAGTLLRVKNSDGSWLIPEPLRSTGTAQEVYQAVEFDHAVLVAFDGENLPQNIWPMLKGPHREKSRQDTTKAAKAKRLRKREEEHRRKLEEKARDVQRQILAPVAKPAALKPKPKYDWGKGRYGRG